ncbi:MAG TPA: hypothetical protein VFZ77_08045 [Acidimicrobiales bacterium]
MTTTDETAAVPDGPGGPAAGAEPDAPGSLRVAAVASLGAGAIHATAAGAHSEHRAAVVAFAVTAILQIGWGALALARRWRPLAAAGAAVNGAALAGWVLAKTRGIGFVDGLDGREDVQFADALAAGLAAVAVAGAVVALAAWRSWAARPRPGLVAVAGVATMALVVPGMVDATDHAHPGGHGDEAAADGHDGHDGGDADHAGAHEHAGEAMAAEPKPYDATLPVDLGGVPGVTAEQQREAEDLVTITLQKLPQFADPDHAYALGYRSIRDAATGYEHFMKWDLIDDGRMLDPDRPESLVYEVDRATGEKRLAAAMYMANRGDTLDTVPDIGGPLVQWHIHDDLCFAGEQGAWVVADVAAPPKECREGTFRLGDPVPMVHVWIVPHECGPFSALEGVGAGQIAEGEERLCDHHHGAPA